VNDLPLRSTTFFSWSNVLLLGAVFLAGCADQGSVTGSRQEGAPRNLTFTRVLVVGVSPDINQRCGFEHFLASRIMSASVKAIASCDVVKAKNPLTRESIEEAVASQQADAVVATTLVSMDWGTKEGAGRDDRGGGMYKATDAGYATGYYGVYGVPVVYGEFQTASSITTVKGTARVTTKVWETRGPTHIYTMDLTVGDLESRDTGLAAITGPIAERLRRDGLIR
jgi:hypothetical protein